MTAPRDTLDPDALLREREWLRRLARGLVRDEASAEDLAQATLDVALSAPPPPMAGRARWLQGIARNLARRQARGAGRRVARERRAARAEATPSAAAVVARLELQRELVDAVMALGEANRRVVVLHYFDGRSAARIAREVGIPASSVRSRLRRSRASLRERLDRRLGGRGAWIALAVPLAREGGLAGASLGTAATLLNGAVIVGTKKTAALAVLVLVLGGVVTWRLLVPGPEAIPPLGPPARPGVAASAPEADPAPPPEPDALRTDPFLPESVPPAPAATGGSEPAPSPAILGIVTGRILVRGQGPLRDGHVFLWGYGEEASELDAEGRFRIATRRTEARSLWLERDGVKVCLPCEVRPRPGATVEVEVELVPGHRLEGHVEIEGSGRRLPGARLTLRARLDDETQQAEAVMLVAGEAGRFAIPLVPPGSYRLEVAHPEATPRNVAIEVPQEGIALEPLVVAVPAVRPLRLHLVNYGEYRERFDRVSLQLYQVAADPVTGVRRTTGQDAMLQGRPDEDGRCDLAAPSPGTWAWELFSYGGFPRQRGEIEIPEGTGPVGLEIRLPPEGRVQVSGRVRYPDGRPFGPALLGLGERRVKVGRDGRYRFERIRVGTHDLVLEVPGARMHVMLHRPRLEVPDVSVLDHDVVLPGGGRIDVRCVEVPAARRADDFVCSLQDAEGRDLQWARGSPDGPAVFLGLAPGRYRVRAVLGPVRLAPRTVEVGVADGPTEVSVPVGEFAAATFRLVTAPGVAPPREVTITTPPGEMGEAPRQVIVRLAVDPEGLCTTDLLTPGAHRVAISAMEFETAELTVVPGGAEPVPVQLHAR